MRLMNPSPQKSDGAGPQDPAPSSRTMRLGSDSSTCDELVDNDDQGDDEKEMNQSPRGRDNQPPQEPQNQHNHDQHPQHGSPPLKDPSTGKPPTRIDYSRF